MSVKRKNMSDTKRNNPVPNFYRASGEDFKKIPGSPIAYWVSERVFEIFKNCKSFDSIAKPKLGMRTGNNEKFIRYWYEVDQLKIGYNFKNALEAKNSGLKWFPYNKGGDFRRWFGNNEYVVNWENDGYEIKKETIASYPQLSWDNLGWKISNEIDFFKPCLEWSRISSSYLGVRISEGGFIFDTNGSSAFPDAKHLKFLVSFLCCKIASDFAKIINPSLAFQPGDLAVLPIIETNSIIEIIDNICLETIHLSKSDWNSYETSWDFTTLPLLSPDYLSPTIEASYQKLRIHWQEMTNDMLSLEEENNKIFIEAYGMQDELTPDVPLSEITLTCNPHYRYDANKPEEELESLLLADTIKELISYAVGCMVGRYSLDKPGLILANQGETIDDYLEQIPEPSFKPDDDNIIPVLDDEYFTDDIVYRFKDFLKTVFGEKTLSQNLDYIAKALTGKSSSSPEKVIRDYFLRDFYKDHLRRYKKRPIYWMFSSGKQQGFNALVYMHRYNKATLSKMRTDYLLELEAKLEAELTSLSEDPVKNKARISKIKKQVDEMRTWDELLNNKALALIEIDLDDGVVVNYAKFEGLVRKI